jgi:hypothetical protein
MRILNGKVGGKFSLLNVQNFIVNENSSLWKLSDDISDSYRGMENIC